MTSIVKLGRNITAEKLRTVEMETQIKAIHKTQAVIVFSPEGIILDANENFLNAMHYKMEEIKGKHHKMFMGDKVGDENGFSFLSFFILASGRLRQVLAATGCWRVQNRRVQALRKGWRGSLPSGLPQLFCCLYV